MKINFASSLETEQNLQTSTGQFWMEHPTYADVIVNKPRDSKNNVQPVQIERLNFIWAVLTGLL